MRLSVGLTKRRSSQTSLQSLSHGEITPVCERGLHQLLLHTQVLKAIVELGIRHLNRELLQHVSLLGVEVEAHLTQPLKGLGVVDLVLDEGSRHVPLVHKLCDLNIESKLQVALKQGALLSCKGK